MGYDGCPGRLGPGQMRVPDRGRKVQTLAHELAHYHAPADPTRRVAFQKRLPFACFAFFSPEVPDGAGESIPMYMGWLTRPWRGHPLGSLVVTDSPTEPDCIIVMDTTLSDAMSEVQTCTNNG